MHERRTIYLFHFLEDAVAGQVIERREKERKREIKFPLGAFPSLPNIWPLGECITAASRRVAPRNGKRQGKKRKKRNRSKQERGHETREKGSKTVHHRE
mmetsp:Transcript_39017/g.76745  ORF Transcript_39017/g.76745 Transcript_39017/m.76745 type:complete len:99 (+) Transcript_39017:457-753(+)